MTMTTTAPPVPTLPAEWTPSGYGCRKTGDHWIWDNHNPKDMRTVLGGPSQTDRPDQCFPSTWATLYAGTACPRDFTTACPPIHSTDPVTCCPTAFNFRCVSEAGKQPHGSTFPCISQFDTTRSIQVTKTDLVESTITFGQELQKTNRHLFALGVVYTTPTATKSDSASPFSTPISTPEPDASSTTISEPDSSSASAITAGAAAGIGVGAAAGVIVIAMLAFFWVYRRKKSNIPNPSPNIRSVYPIDSKARLANAHPRELDTQSGRSWRELEG